MTETEYRNNLINKYTNVIVNLNINDILLLQNGFVDNKCNTIILSILMHCIDSIGIFDKDRLNNIKMMINNISHGG